MGMNTQCSRLIDYMKTGKHITQYQALQELSILRLASRINDLRKAGYVIMDRFVVGTNKYGEAFRVKEYWMEGIIE